MADQVDCRQFVSPVPKLPGRFGIMLLARFENRQIDDTAKIVGRFFDRTLRPVNLSLDVSR